ncbi:hypothetical protein N234_31825 [Ralstonia pickettii DTP0602]|nr:hypothetical protein N234_31825 [Ralstonia pickettii DTP0602]
MSKYLWQPHEIEAVLQLYPTSKTSDLAEALGRSTTSIYRLADKLGLRKTAEYLATPDARRLDGSRDNGHRFRPGHVSWNKGIKGSAGQHPNTVRAHFKKGERRGAANTNYVPIGTERITDDGYLVRKVTDDPSLVPARRWIAVHRLVWEAAHGPIPPGHAVVFLPGRRTTDAALITVDALELVTRGELARRNHPRSRSPELAKLVQLKGAITRQVNRIAREAKEQQS